MSVSLHLKTALLLGILYGVLIAVGSLIAGESGIGWALGIAALINFAMYFYSDKMVLSMYHATQISAESHPRIFNMVADLCEEADIPMPKVYLIRSNNANAFATGRNPEHASIAFTSSIIQLLDEDELRAVAAHELSHVKNRDILIGTIAATLAMAISYAADMIRWSMYWGRSSNDRKNSHWLPVFLSVIFAPLIATLIRLAISRSREFLADESGAHLSHTPLALASALEKIHGSPVMEGGESYAHASTAHLFISNPFKASSVLKIFSTHPPLEERVKRLRSMAR